MINAQNLAKSFGNREAVQGISFEVETGEIFGLLGPNGAGKTTTLSMLAGLLKPDRGRVSIGGFDLASKPRRVKGLLGVVPQEDALYDELTPREHLHFWAGLYGLSGGALKAAVAKALELVGLTPRADDPVLGFSGGLKRRLSLSIGLVHEPRAVLLDEPTAGIDPQARANILEAVRAVADRGTAMIYTTHYLEEVEQICDRIAIMDHGQILAEGDLASLQRQAKVEEIVTLRGRFEPGDQERLLARLNGVRLIASEPDRLVLELGAEQRNGGAIQVLSQSFHDGLRLEGLTLEPPSLNRLFLKLTGRELRD